MAKITVNLFGELQEGHRAKGISPVNYYFFITSHETVESLIQHMGLNREKIECVFVNGRVAALTTKLKDGDRIGFVPYGTPGPHRFLLGIYNSERNK